MELELGITQAIRQGTASYDASCKRLLSEKQVLARIMQGCIDAYRDIDPDVIASTYIEGDARVGIEPVGRDAERLRGLPTEDVTVAEGTVLFDIRFDATIPNTNERVRIEVDVEAQNKFAPGYPLTSRAVYYCGRMLSMQGAGEVVGSRYERLRKVYSIWICTNPPREFAGTLTRFSLTQDDLVGQPPYERKNYDLVEIVMVCLGKSPRLTESELLGFLQTLLDPTMAPEDKITILSSDYGMMCTESFEGEVREMCNLSEGVIEIGLKRGLEQGIERGLEQGLERGLEQGLEQGRIEATLSSIKNLMANLSLSAEQAMQALGIDESSQQQYLDLLAAD